MVEYRPVCIRSGGADGVCLSALHVLLGDAQEEGFAIAGDGVRDEPLHGCGRSGLTGGSAGEMGPFS